MTAHTKASPEAIHEFIVGFVEQHGYSPTVREIAKGVGLQSQSAVQRTLSILRAQGRVSYVDGMSRTVRPLM